MHFEEIDIDQTHIRLKSDLDNINLKRYILRIRSEFTVDDIRYLLKTGRVSKFLSKFAMRTDAGIGVDSPYKMQFAIDINGPWKVLWAAIAGGFCKIFGKHGVFYEIVGKEVSGLDGFYGDVFSDYSEFGIKIPQNPNGVCNEIYEKTGVKSMIVDANDFNQEILGKADAIEESEEELIGMIKDNPCGQAKTLTPMVLIRKVK